MVSKASMIGAFVALQIDFACASDSYFGFWLHFCWFFKIFVSKKKYESNYARTHCAIRNPQMQQNWARKHLFSYVWSLIMNVALYMVSFFTGRKAIQPWHYGFCDLSHAQSAVKDQAERLFLRSLGSGYASHGTQLFHYPWIEKLQS